MKEVGQFYHGLKDGMLSFSKHDIKTHDAFKTLSVRQIFFQENYITP